MQSGIPWEGEGGRGMQRGYHDVQGGGGWRGAQVGSRGVVEGARRVERCNSGVTRSRGGGQEGGEVQQWYVGLGRLC